MSGLLEGAKQKIWSIVNQMADGTPRPDIRVALIGYRDRGDQYVTKRFELTRDIDGIYSELVALSADGGGDTPESVNEALHEAVTKLGWSDSQSVYKVVFLVGDAPPHRDYPNDVQYRETVRRAAARGIVVNTVQCGDMAETTTVWQDIATAGSGEYVAIAQDGAMVALSTPMDEELSKLNAELAATALPYGSRAERDGFGRVLIGASSAPASVAAARLAFNGKNGAKLSVGRSDLVEATREGSIELGDLPAAELPAEMQPMAPKERRLYLEQKAETREEIAAKIAGLASQRDAYVAIEKEKLRARGEAGGFDEKVLDVIRSQAAAKGITY